MYTTPSRTFYTKSIINIIPIDLYKKEVKQMFVKFQRNYLVLTAYNINYN